MRLEIEIEIKATMCREAVLALQPCWLCINLEVGPGINLGCRKGHYIDGGFSGWLVYPTEFLGTACLDREVRHEGEVQEAPR